MRRLIDVTLLAPTPHDIIAVGPQVPDLYCVVYRTGGTVNFKWHRSLALTKDEVQEAFEGVTLMGYVCHIEHFFASLAIGLPETYSPDFPLEKDWH
jgi:hypothetical protein